MLLSLLGFLNCGRALEDISDILLMLVQYIQFELGYLAVNPDI